jgi:hypothetical protein
MIFDVCIPKQYFHRSRWPELGEYIATYTVEATDREEAAAKIWCKYGIGYLLAMVPHISRLPRKVSLFVSGGKTPPGRLLPILVFTGYGPLDERIGKETTPQGESETGPAQEAD